MKKAHRKMLEEIISTAIRCRARKVRFKPSAEDCIRAEIDAAIKAGIIKSSMDEAALVDALAPMIQKQEYRPMG